MDTRRIVKPSEGSVKPVARQIIPRKTAVSNFLPEVENQIVYAFKWRQQEPRAIAGELSRRSGVRVQVRAINEVIRRAIPDRRPVPANVMREAA